MRLPLLNIPQADCLCLLVVFGAVFGSRLFGRRGPDFRLFRGSGSEHAFGGNQVGVGDGANGHRMVHFLRSARAAPQRDPPARGGAGSREGPRGPTGPPPPGPRGRGIRREARGRGGPPIRGPPNEPPGPPGPPNEPAGLPIPPPLPPRMPPPLL